MTVDEDRDVGAELAEMSGEVALACLLLAAVVAWADGVVQPEERDRILALTAAEEALWPGLDRGRVEAWLDHPPSEGELREALTLLARGAAPADLSLQAALETARASGGVGGFGAIGQEEAETLRWLRSMLEPGRPLPRTAAVQQWLDALNTMRSVLTERALASAPSPWTAPVDAPDLWPVACPRFAAQMPPAVFGVPEPEVAEYRQTVVRRYVRMLARETWDCLRVARTEPDVLDDARLAELLWSTPFSRFLTLGLDPSDAAVFAEVVAGLPAGTRLFKVDHTRLDPADAVPGVRVAPTLGLFAQHSGGLTPLAIRVGEHLARPGDGEAWARARLFLLQGCSLALVGGVHSLLHFPTDAVIAVTRSLLPPAHPVARLIAAHAYLQLPLNYGVRWNPRSYAHNSQQEIYTSFPNSREGIFRSFSQAYVGVEGNRAFPAYRYPMGAPAVHGPYGDALRAYYAPVRAFCRTVAEAAPVDALRPWAEALHGLLPGFPTAEEIADPEVLASALAGFVHGCSIWHSLEHHLYSQIPVHHNPHRLRVDPPTGEDLPTRWWQRTRKTDRFRQELARRMFYEAHSIRGILDVEHGFEDPALREAAATFLRALRRVESGLPERYRGLEHVACSIQF